MNQFETTGYPVTGYTARKAERSAESEAVGFMETVAEKVAQDKTTDYSDILGNTVGSAIQATKQALYDLDNPIAPAYRSIDLHC